MRLLHRLRIDADWYWSTTLCSWDRQGCRHVQHTAMYVAQQEQLTASRGMQQLCVHVGCIHSLASQLNTPVALA